jgi:hypothetical protein
MNLACCRELHERRVRLRSDDGDLGADRKQLPDAPFGHAAAADHEAGSVLEIGE